MRIKVQLQNIISGFMVLFCLVICSCKQETSAEEETEVDARTPVTVTTISFDPLQEFIELNATSTYLQKSYVKSNVNGYIKSVNVKYAGLVTAGQAMFVLKTKESEAIGNTINNLDPDFKFSGINQVRASTGGYVSELNHQVGDYVQDGEQLAVISNLNSFVFLMDLPYENKRYVSNNKQVELTLPDGERILGTIQTSMPFMDSVSQTQAVAIKISGEQQIPQGLVAKVKIITISKAAASSLPKAAVLSDETQADYWIMKLINDSIAVKVAIKIGIQTADKIEVLSPAFSPTDKIILTGNYGLGDTAKIKIETPGMPEKEDGEEK